MARLCISLLGPFQVTLDGDPVTEFKSNKVRALLAYLAVEAQRRHDRDVLAGLLWPDWPNRAARSNLRYALSNLRKAIGDRTAAPPFLLISRDTIQFNAASDSELDVAAFAGVPGQDAGPAAIDELRLAAGAYRGHFLEGFSLPDSAPFEEWALLKREQIRRAVVAMLQRLAAHHEERAEHEQACGYVRRQLELEPWQEESHQQLMRLLAASGQRSAALAQYEACRRLLAEELGVEPGAETTQLYEEIRDGEHEPPRRPTSSPAAARHNLPASLIPFVGREAELADIGSRLQDSECRLLTLVGPGGCGKTRLGVETAAAQIDRFEHGVWFVPLAPLPTPESIVPAIARALRLPFLGQTQVREQLVSHLRTKNMLLVLDNFEHLLGGAGLVTDLLRGAPSIQILVTSRAQLGVRGEQLFPLVGMDHPALRESLSSDLREPQDVSQYSAVQLFLQSAPRAQPGFLASEVDLTHVARICALVEGMPLGILLAAAWTEILSPAEIAAEIDRSLDFLETEWRDVPEQQRSLRAVFDRSWTLLSEREQDIFQSLSVFRGGFTRQAAEQVSGATLRDLKALVSKSFLQPTPVPRGLRDATAAPSTTLGAWGRYETHELLRQYAEEKLAQSEIEATAAHDRHSAYYAAALQHWAVDLKGPRQQAALAEMSAEGENLRLSWYWAVEQSELERLAQAMEGLQLFYWLHYRYLEGEAAMRAAAGELAVAAERPAVSGAAERPAPSRVGESIRAWAWALIWQSNFGRVLGRGEQPHQLQQQAQALLNRPELADQDTRFERALLLQTMGRTVILTDHEGARQLLKQALPLYREVGDSWRMANVLEALGRAAFIPGDAAEARRWFEEAISLFRSLGDDSGMSRCSAWLSRVAAHQGHFEEAESLARWAARTLEQHGNPAEFAWGLVFLSYTLFRVGKYDEALSVLQQGRAIWGERERPDYASHLRAELGAANLHLGGYEEAESFAQIGLALARESGPQFTVGYSLFLLGGVALTRGAYVEAHQSLQEAAAVFRQLRQKGDLSETLALLGRAAYGLGEPDQAWALLAEALHLGQESGYVAAQVWALAMIGGILADQGVLERAVELGALASRYPFVANSRWFEDVAGRPIAAAAAESLPPDVVAAAQERGRARDLHVTVAELSTQLGTRG